MRGEARGRRIRLGASVAAALLAGCRQAPDRPIPAGYPGSYAALERAADDEGALTIWSAVDRGKASGLLASFRRLHPRVAVTYVEMPSATLNARFLASAARGRPTADLLWSSAMDLQIKLVNDGYTQAYASPEARHLPSWANWKNEAWGVTSEPIAIIYNRTRIDDASMPRSHAALTQFLETHRAGEQRVAIAAPGASATAYLYLSQDQQTDNGFWRLASAMGRTGIRQFTSAEEVLRDVVAGRSSIGYNIVGSYARDEAKRHARLGYLLPSDYTLMMSRIALIPAGAPHPSAAKLFLDVMLSAPGQLALDRAGIGAIRRYGPLPGPPMIARRSVRAIRVGPTLLVSQDRLTRQSFLLRWSDAVASRPSTR